MTRPLRTDRHATVHDDDASPGDADWRDAIGATAALWLFVLLLYLPVIVERHAGEGAVSVVLDGATVFVSMLLALPIFALFRATLGWRPEHRFVLLALAVVAAAIVQAAFDLLFTAVVTRTLESAWSSLPVDLRRGYGAMTNYVSVFGVNLALFQLGYARRRARRQERRYAAMLASGQQAELEALRFRLNPHFLFNTLNAISAMIVTQRTGDADRTVERLASFLRASYAYDPMLPIAVEDELAVIEHYARIEEARFGDRLLITVDCDEPAAALRMPALLVQPLLEAAIDTTTDGPPASTRIRVVARVERDRLWIEVTHDPARSARPEAAGLAALRRRLEATYGARAGMIVERGGVAAWMPAELAERA